MARHKFKFPQPTRADIQLIDAAQNGDYGRCVDALNDGARVDAVDHHYATPLGMACQSNSIEIVRLLLERGANPNLLAGQSKALLEAVHRGNREIIELLIESGANIETKAELAPGAFLDLPGMAAACANRKLAIELRSLINQQKMIKDGRRLRLKEVASQLDLDETGKPKNP